jgi:TonB-dependent SusC/RagA subfamily outer membrane receptor
MTACLVTVASIAWPVTGHAQRVAATTPDAPIVRAPQRVTVSFDNALVRTVLSAIVQQAGLKLMYDEAILPPDARVTLHVKDMPVGDALQQALHGTGLTAQLQVTGNVVIMRGSEASVTGGVSGVVTDAATKKPLAGAAVVVDSGKPVRTRDNGTFLLANVPVGTHRVVVRLIGYRVYSAPVTIRDGATEHLVIALTPSATTLTDVVTTATGDRKRYEVGNAVGTIKADSLVATNVIRNVSDLLQARVPGVVVQNTDGAVGAPSRIRLRGLSSLSLNNDPIVILDGVRLNAQATVANNQTNVGSTQLLNRMVSTGGTNSALAPSRLDDIDPNTIESIDILRGPSASSLYGTDAANGVIVIKTKRGQAGAWRTNLVGDNGWSHIPGQMEQMWWGYWSQSGTTGTDCLLATGPNNVANGSCHQDSVRQFNPQNNARMTTLGTGTTRSLSGSVSGGSDQLQEFLSARGSSQVGISKMSAVEQRLIPLLWGGPAPSWMVHPNTEQDIDGTSRTTFQVSPKIDVSLTSNAIYRSVLNGGSGIQSVYLGAGASPSDSLGFLPSESERTKLSSTAKRGIVSGTGNYRPLGWLHLTGALGGDYTLRTDAADLRAQDCTAILAAAGGITAAQNCPSGHSNRRDETFVTTANGGANLSFSPTSWLTLRTSLGEQYSHTDFYTLMAGNSNPVFCPLAFGSTLLTPSPVCMYSQLQRYTLSEDQDEAATAGWYVEETISMFGLFTTFGRRQDVASAFGGHVNKSPPNYPKFNFSYPISEQSFFPKQSLVSSLRLRLAYGQSGNQASQLAVLNGYAPGQVTYATSSSVVNLVTLTQLGNPNLRPERGTEWEGGFDVSFLDNERVHVEATMSRKYTRDAIVQIQEPVSYGVDNLNEYVNLGNVEDRSLELSARLRVLDLRSLGWDLTINGTRLRNKLVHKSPTLGSDGPTNSNNFTEGYPLYGLWGAPVVSYDDRNGDGILAQNEIVFGPVSYMGAPYPSSEITYANDISLLNRSLRVSATFDQVNGVSNRYEAQFNRYPRAAVDPTAPLSAQAAWIQATVNTGNYLNKSNTVRFNELSVSYDVPPSIAQRLLRVHSLALTFAGRNLAVWTSYIGKDPNVDTSQQLGDATTDGGLGTPQPRNFMLRFNLGL